MGIQQGLSPTIQALSDQNYDQPFAFYRLWFDIARAHSEISPIKSLTLSGTTEGRVRYNLRSANSFTPLLPRLFVSRVMQNRVVFFLHSVSLRIRLCTRFLIEFFKDRVAWHVEYGDGSWLGGDWDRFYICANFVAHSANLGCADESVIRVHILQPLASHQKLYNHQADGLVILLRLAGATFEKYADHSVVDRFFELLEGQYGNNAVKAPLIQVRVVSPNGGLQPG